MIFEATINGEKIRISNELVARYDLPLPRYTSYPTAPIWSDTIGTETLRGTLSSWNPKRSLSLYIHIPFCAEGCLFCGCHSIVTKNQRIITDYLDALRREITNIAGALPAGCTISEIHLGGGSPNSLSDPQMQELFDDIRSAFEIDANAEISIEADPRTTTGDQLSAWSNLGINRISLGVQDTALEVQAAIGRIQPKEKIEHLVNMARSLGFNGINFDLVYGLPLQTPDSFSKTIDDIIGLDPDRVALFNFAYLPLMKPRQRHIQAKHLPKPADKFAIFCNAISRLQDAALIFIGMDHFAKKDDPLSSAAAAGRLNRNFQGYTAARDMPVVGLGVTGISDLNHTYLQNERRLSRYIDSVRDGHFATTRGYLLSDEDQLRRRIIRDLFCNNKIVKTVFSAHFNSLFDGELRQLELLEKDGLLKLSDDEIVVTATGRLFIRNIAAVFDAHLSCNTSTFSRSV